MAKKIEDQNPTPIPNQETARLECQQDRECPICQEKDDPDPRYIPWKGFVALPCGHSGHVGCLQQWINSSPNKDCFMCRRSLVNKKCGCVLDPEDFLEPRFVRPDELNSSECHYCFKLYKISWEREIGYSELSCLWKHLEIWDIRTMRSQLARRNGSTEMIYYPSAVVKIARKIFSNLQARPEREGSDSPTNVEAKLTDVDQHPRKSVPEREA